MSSVTIRLMQARERLRQAQLRVEEQVVLIEQLADTGRSTAAAERLLATYMAIMDQFSVRCDRLQRELDRAVFIQRN